MKTALIFYGYSFTGSIRNFRVVWPAIVQPLSEEFAAIIFRMSAGSYSLCQEVSTFVTQVVPVETPQSIFDFHRSRIVHCLCHMCQVFRIELGKLCTSNLCRERGKLSEFEHFPKVDLDPNILSNA